MSLISRITSPEKGVKLVHIPISEIVTNPNQPRRTFEKESIQELALSIEQYGLLQPITVRRGNYSKYELIAGERRMRAIMLLGHKTIPALLMEATGCDSAMLALIENLQRENLNYIDEAESYHNLLLNFGLTQEDLARKIGKTQASVANKLRILRLPLSIQKVLREQSLTERHARALLRLSGEEQQHKILQTICDEQLNVKQTEALVDELRMSQICLDPSATTEAEQGKQETEPTPPKPLAPAKSVRVIKDVRIFVNTIRQAVELMRKSGIEAQSEQKEAEGYIEYVIRIPKQKNIDKKNKAC